MIEQEAFSCRFVFMSGLTEFCWMGDLPSIVQNCTDPNKVAVVANSKGRDILAQRTSNLGDDLGVIQ